MRKIGFLLFSGIVGATAYLGAWQTKRYFWKVEVMEDRESKLARDPLELSSLRTFLLDPASVGARSNADDAGDDAIDESEFTTVSVQGKLIDSESLLLGPRSPPKHSAPFENNFAEKSGYHIITPLEVDSTDSEGRPVKEVILVNRGWVQKSKHVEVLEQIRSKKEDKGSDAVKVTGVVRSGEGKPSGFIPCPDLVRRHFYAFDVPAMTQFIQTSVRVIVPFHVQCPHLRFL